MERGSGPPGQNDERELTPLISRTPPEPGTEAGEVITEVIALYPEFPAWAVWLPWRGGCWTAVRPAASRAPGPDMPMVWVHAATAAELGMRMRGVDAQVAGL